MTDHGPATLARLVASLSTSVKVLAVMTLALLPLGLIAFLASLQAARSADAQRRADLNIAINEAGRKLGTELISDMLVLAQAARSAATDQAANEICSRPEAVFAARANRPVAFAIFSAGPMPVCKTPGARFEKPMNGLLDARPLLRIDRDMLELVVPANAFGSVAIARYPIRTLAAFARPTGYNNPYQLRVDIDGQSLWIVDTIGTAPLAGGESAIAVIGLSSATLEMTLARAPSAATSLAIAFLPLLMWAAGALVAFYVVERLLILPLKQLRQDVHRLAPGGVMPQPRGATPAVEIGELRHSFASFADRIAAREAELDRAFADQVRLTREVHHRVKNNLQVIASLISLHARAAAGNAAVTGAYATIQRRVDALAIVHRNHFAELEANGGIAVRALLSELSSNFRAGAMSGTKAPTITVSADAITVTQDIAMPLAFLFTELAEQAIDNDFSAGLKVTALADGAIATATLALSSASFIGPSQASPQAQRIVEGLARQLRAPLDHDAVVGRYAIQFPISEPIEDIG